MGEIYICPGEMAENGEFRRETPNCVYFMVHQHYNV
jgi:hypothetical protein